MLKNGERLYEITRKVMQFAAWISIAVVVFNLVLLSANVFMRYVFNAPIKGTSEIVTMMMAWVAYMGMAYTLLNEKHMQLEAIYEKLHGRPTCCRWNVWMGTRRRRRCRRRSILRGCGRSIGM